jgi:coenzyme PQQ synthesis protein D (PqqD)
VRNPPKARRDLLATSLEEEVVVYDPERQLAHSLNRTALAVWNRCNGHNSVTDLRRLVGAELGLPIDEGAVWLALRRLESAHLLVGTIDRAEGVSRREMLRKAGRVGMAAVATPVVASVLVPVAAAAASGPSGLPACGDGKSERIRRAGSKSSGGQGKSDDEAGCSSVNSSCVCSKTTSGERVCINPSTALKKTTCQKDTDCRSGYLCIPRGNAPPRCIAPCAVPTCAC